MMKTFLKTSKQLVIICILLASSTVIVAQTNRKKNGEAKFNKIELNIAGKVIITQSQKSYVRIKGRSSRNKNIDTKITNGTLTINDNELIDKKTHISKNKNGKTSYSIDGKKDFEGVTIFVGTPKLSEVRYNGVGELKFDKTIVTDKLLIEFNGVGSIDSDNLSCKELEINYVGVGEAVLIGKTDKVIIYNEGMGRVKGAKMIAQHAIATLEGMGKIDVCAIQSVDLTLDGIGSIAYFGNPEIVKITNDGLGSIARH